MKRRVLLQLGIPLLILCALFLLLAYPADRTLRPQPLLEVSVILRETDASLWTNARQGMEQAAMDLDVELRFLTPAQNNDAAQQAELLKREASGGAQAAVLVAADREVLAQTVAGLSGKLPVVSLETDMTHDGAVCFVGTDNQALGRSLGEAVLHGVEKGGTVVLLDSAPGDNAVTQRVAEAQSVLEAAGRSVAICRPEGDETIAQALESILAQTDAGAVAAFEASALETAAQVRTGENALLLYGMGATAEVTAGLERGKNAATAAQNEFAAGYLTVAAAVESIRNTDGAQSQTLPFFMVRRENMYDPDYQKLLFPVTQ